MGHRALPRMDRGYARPPGLMVPFAFHRLSVAGAAKRREAKLMGRSVLLGLIRFNSVFWERGTFGETKARVGEWAKRRIGDGSGSPKRIK
jgi:hypothetical protein